LHACSVLNPLFGAKWLNVLNKTIPLWLFFRKTVDIDFSREGMQVLPATVAAEFEVESLGIFAVTLCLLPFSFLLL